MDDTTSSPGGTWISPGAYGSGDFRGYWITSVFRPTDYKPSLLGTTVALTIFSTDNSTSASESHVIDHNYLVGFAHTEDYAGAGNVTNGTRTIYSFDNGLTWKKGPWGTAVLVVVDSRTDPENPRLVSVGNGTTRFCYSLETGTGWQGQPNNYNPSNFAFNNALFYNRYLGKWMIWYGKWGSQHRDVWTAVSNDLLTWEWGTGAVGLEYPIPGGVTRAGGNYPTMLGSLPSDVVGTCYDMESGQLAWLYNNMGGLGGRAVHFIKGKRQQLNWTGASNSQLATVSNWSSADGTSFSQFQDEKQSLNIATGGGSLINDIPSTIRLRDIAFAAGAGSYTLGGNTLQLEAVTQGGLASISNASGNIQTIAADIDARSAALYIRSSSGALVFDGDIDMRGNGGIVVYGTGTTTINGSISNSGYADFLTQQSEFIAAANAGRLVKQDASNLNLNGANSFNGRTDILGGTITVNHQDALQNSVVSFDADNALVLNTPTKLGGLNGRGNLNLGNNNLILGNSNFESAYPTRYSGVLSGAASITKVGLNVQRLGPSNSYSGGTVVTDGVLEIPAGVNTALGTGAVSLSGGTLKALGTLSLNNPIVTIAGGGIIDTNGNNVTLSGQISGSGSLETSGAGSLILTGTNTYTGGTVIKNLVQIAQNGALGTGEFELQGGGLQLSANVDLGSQPLLITATGSVIDTGIFTLTSSGPITVAAGLTFVKEGLGTFKWAGSGAAFDGSFVIDEGTVEYTRNGTSALTNGSISLSGSRLLLQPTGTNGNVVVNLAPTPGSTVDILGSGILFLNRGQNSSLTVNIGNTGNLNALNKGATSTFLMTPASNTAALGANFGVRVFAVGTANTPAPEIFSPSVLATSGTDGQADFVKYHFTNGFQRFGSYDSRLGSFQLPTTPSSSIVDLGATGTLSANSYARALRISGSASLNLNGKILTLEGFGTEAGLIVNKGSVTGGGSIAFGGRRGYLFTSGTTASIGSVISGSGGLSVFGIPGTELSLTGANTFGGGVIVNGAKLRISGGGLGAASGSVTLDGHGSISISGSSVTSSRSFIIGSGGGTIESSGSNRLILSSRLSGPGDWRKTGTGILQLNANNDFSGSVYVDAGQLAFNGRSTFYGTSGSIHVASGANFTLWGWGTSTTPISNDFVVEGTGIGGSGAIEVGGDPTVSGDVALSGSALIKASATSSATFSGFISSFGDNLELAAPGASAPIRVDGSIALGTGGLTVTGSGGATFGVDSIARYAGPTIVAAGSKFSVRGEIEGTSGIELYGTLAGDGNITTTGEVAVANGATVLAGIGNAPGTLTVAGDLSFNTGSEFQCHVDNSGASISGNGEYGQLVVLGECDLNGTLRIFRNASFTPQSGDQLYVVLRNGGAGQFAQVVVVDNGVAGQPVSGAAGTAITIGGVQGVLSYSAQSSQAITSGGKDVLIQF